MTLPSAMRPAAKGQSKQMEAAGEWHGDTEDVGQEISMKLQGGGLGLEEG